MKRGLGLGYAGRDIWAVRIDADIDERQSIN